MRLPLVLIALVFEIMSVTAIAGEPAPLLTRDAKPVPDIRFGAGYQSFTDMQLDEAGKFDGDTYFIEATMPLSEAGQLRFYTPLRTSGEAIMTAPFVAKINIKGNVGIFDFTSLEYQRTSRRSGPEGIDFAWYATAGTLLKWLDTTYGDRYNHHGWNLGGGVRAGAAWDWGRWLGNAGLIYYGRSDDLNPGHSDVFSVVDLRLANVFSPIAPGLYPAVELTYFGDFSAINHTTLGLEMLYHPGKSIELKAGATVGLGGNGNGKGARLEAHLHY